MYQFFRFFWRKKLPKIWKIVFRSHRLFSRPTEKLFQARTMPFLKTLGMGTEPLYMCIGDEHDSTRPSRHLLHMPSLIYCSISLSQPAMVDVSTVCRQ